MCNSLVLLASALIHRCVFCSIPSLCNHSRSSFSALVTMLGWLSRCLPGFSIIALVLMLVLAFSDVLNSPQWRSLLPPSPKKSPSNSIRDELSAPQQVFVFYVVFVHIHMFAFTVRLAWSIFRVTKETRAAIQRRVWQTPEASPALDHGEFLDSPRLSPSQSLPDPSIVKINGVTVQEICDPELVHAIILPNYGEDLHTLETTLRVLASHPRAHSQYEVSLGLPASVSQQR